MVNRRILRIKALQALYANEKSRDALYNIGLQSFDETFNPFIFENPDRDLLKAQKGEAKKLFAQHFKEIDPVFSASEEIVLEKVKEAIDDYQSGVKGEAVKNRKEMMKELDAVNGTFISIMALLIDLSRISEDFKKKNFGKNQVITLLRESPEVKKQLPDSTIKWSQHYDTVRSWFRDILTKNDGYQAYEDLENPSFSDDKAILALIVKKVLFKNDSIQDFLDENDMRWVENKAIVKSLATKSIKDIEEGEEIHLRPISYNWEEDKDFFDKLYIETLSRETVLEPIIADNSRNWEYERIASVDKIILRMALTEMIIFPSIPVKVTINEYLEVAKLYSTPKSKQFINGVLDITAKKLVSDGIIKKSGRGLIDNK